ncbi:hypothetical protein N656DRAFT_40360 [Canariomyces notabilis]|uniref:Uncharacterized protein n=1 Tax=Canariomyces notabilis TaxID=2074819 RepID=A0AAN6TMX3_9PEZI|nr:hypothetical protein N656DRAFT_40360 [Canariomyces arenarius]
MDLTRWPACLHILCGLRGLSRSALVIPRTNLGREGHPFDPFEVATLLSVDDSHREASSAASQPHTADAAVRHPRVHLEPTSVQKRHVEGRESNNASRTPTGRHGRA